MPRRKYAGKTDIGFQRKNNEDAFFFSPEQHFCLTADGVGGAAAGGLASKIFSESTIETFTDNSTRSGNETKHRVQKAFRLANDKILKHVTQNPVNGKACPEDLFLLCSDGLTDMVPDDQIRDILCSGIEIHRKVEELIETAKSAGGNDNITVVLAAVY